MKGLPPSLRKRKRYIAFRFIGDGEFEESDVRETLKKNSLELFGELESPNFRLIEFKNNSGIVMCSHTEVDKIKIVLTLTDKIGGRKIVPLILGVSGTIRSCVKKYLEVLNNADSSDGVRQGNYHIQP